MPRWFAGLPLLVLPTIAFAASVETRTFLEPIDAVSVQAPHETLDLEVSGFDGKTWSDWRPLTIDNEQDPWLRESNLVMFDKPVGQLRFRGTTTGYTIHPIRVSNAPSKERLVSAGDMPFHIISREEWGADPAFLTKGTATVDDSNDVGDHADSSSSTVSSYGQSSKRVQDCEEAYRNYPDEFRRERAVTKTRDGKTLRWPQEYSPSVRLLVVHHTDMDVLQDHRSSLERLRALYSYHANSRGWGDIGYNYVVDESGNIYEGRAGGDYVVAGHAYCNNVGSMGIALMGNLEAAPPTQAQAHSLEQLLDYLARKYRIDVNGHVTFHGKSIPTVVGHRDLLSTSCPGYYMYNVLDQVRANTARQNFTVAIRFPDPPSSAPPDNESSPKERVDRTAERKARRESLLSVREGLHAIGNVELEGRPLEEQAVSAVYQAGPRSHQRGSSAGIIRRSNDKIGVWLDKAGAYQRLRDDLPLPTFVTAGQELSMRLKIQFPADTGTATLQIGDLLYTLTTSGRRMRGAVEASADTSRTYSPPPAPRPATVRPTVTTSTVRPSTATSSSSSSSAAAKSVSQSATDVRMNGSSTIRIRLSIPDADSITLRSAMGTVSLVRRESDCQEVQMTTRGTGIYRTGATDLVTTVASWNTPYNRFRGIIECRVIDGKLALINELPIEWYLAGLGEEPDTEPYEKQRAFAVAARSYATFYLSPSSRKYPGMPYDGSDDPASFQKYSGVTFEEKNPQWVRAVQSTALQVLTVDGAVLKPPYFSSDDGRTRSPEEVSAAWAKSLQKPSMFASKDDHWCNGLPLAGHGIGMSGCGAEGQANEGKKAEAILEYYYPSALLERR